ncbi:hypothetical protein FEM48_Zijuj11G0151100 [Ziziphus jujuba var. spinosa]|uniref:Uncharacterized protein n=1 Tax=Ziziphus jujuba var. spinosa TaxID=714518 RepID=A0A978UJN1_ZIZJJ|nr:hypothetical protein FEM48_Zijuj11G0151100 [Ziziphus jujuba var. spinosa]
MRLHPPAPLLAPRESMDKCILDGFKILAKTWVVINTFAIGMDPKSWEDPLVYNPERFIDNQNNKIGSVVDVDHVKDQEFMFVPFGGGRRGCPGFAFGLATMEIALARLLKKSTPVLIPKTNKDFPVVRKWVPIESYRVKCMSILGLLLDKDAPLVWRRQHPVKSISVLILTMRYDSCNGSSISRLLDVKKCTPLTIFEQQRGLISSVYCRYDHLILICRHRL